MLTDLVLAHTGACKASEVVSTLGITGAIGVLLFRPWRAVSTRMRVTGIAVPLLLAAVVTGGACSSKSSTACSGGNVNTPAKLTIDSPGPNEVTPPDFSLKMHVDGATVVAQTTGKIVPNRGHIHVSVDGKLVSMAYGTSQDLHGLSAGTHAIQAEFVNICHQPFKNRVVASVLFMVKAS
jgi:hypothetical protein